MRALLTALREGRLVELPEANKERALEYLANLIEAVPDMPSVGELYEAMLARERTMNTAIGRGIACPHVRAAGNGELVCAVGWSPSGIDYGAPDGKKVHLVVMYYIPESQKNVYLKEISSLAAAAKREGDIQSLASADGIGNVRERLLDWVTAAVDANMPEAKARMIRLEARQAATEAAPLSSGALQLASVLVLQVEGQKPVVLCQQADLAAALERDDSLGLAVQQRGQFDRGGYRLVFRNATAFANGRTLYEFLAVRTGWSLPPPKPGA
ncbi:MAG TPA: PTS sugar transporter subunit IIA [Myxococcales bacterium]|nr:PTS sugar transporter subunit IIA [Myxococcales bacterium]